MPQDQKSKISNKTPFLLFLILSSLFVGLTLGYAFATNSYLGINIEFLSRSNSASTNKKPSLLTENINLCFTPPAGCTEVIVNAVSAAKKSIYVQAYGMTSPPIVEALIQAHKRGVLVQILLDKSNLKDRWSKMSALLEADIDVTIDNLPGIAHNKIMIIDKSRVITGSFNFTRSADSKNAENVLIIDDKTVAKQYLQNWFFCKFRNDSIR